MKKPPQIEADIERRLAGRWHLQLTGQEKAFPHAFPIGKPSTAELKSDYSKTFEVTTEWQAWAGERNVTLEYENRIATGGARQVVPTRAIVDSLDHAARLLGDDWPERITNARIRLDTVCKRYPLAAGSPQIATTLRLIETYSELDFQLLQVVADWYLEDPSRASRGVTPRQVPIPGVHAKWLQSHQAGVKALTGLDDLGVLPPHPSRIHFTYLDRQHRAAGRRVHDSATVGDNFVPEYIPEVVIISKNKDTAIHFPLLDRAISVEGVGRGGKTSATFPWIRNAPVLIYWGDMDRDGYEILAGYRVDFDRDIDSVLMDDATYWAYEKYGTDHDKNGRLLQPGASRLNGELRSSEHAVYQMLLAADHAGHRRIEQERIDLQAAVDAVLAVRAESRGAVYGTRTLVAESDAPSLK